MDLKHYYQKIRGIEAKIVDEFPLVVSRETPDGGKEGTKTEVPKRLAAKLIVDGLARLANEAEKAAFQSAQAEAIRVAEQLAAAAKVQVTVLASSELERLRKAASK
jgi:hypothetical protein